MFGTTDWLLKRFLKFVLKRNVGKYLSSEIDLEQLDVKLETGRLELKNLLLNSDAVNRDLALGDWHVKAGYIGSVVAKLPLVSLSSAQCSVVVNEVMLTIAPKPPSGLSATGAPPSAHGPAGSDGAVFPQDIGPASAGSAVATSPRTSGAGGAMGFLLADDFGWTGQGAVIDGIKRIAGSLQSMLQHMRVEASNVLVRVELPHPTEKGRVVIAAIKLDLVEFGELLSSAGSPVASAAASGSPASQQPASQPHDHRHPHPHPNHHQHHYHHHHDQSNTKGPGARGGGRGLSDAGDASNGNGPAGSQSNGAAKREIAKHIQVKGLSLDLFESAPLMTGEASAGAATTKCTSAPAHPASPSPKQSAAAATSPGTRPAPAAASAGVTLVSGPGKHGVQLSVELRMVTHDDPQHHPTQISADLHLGAVRLQLLPSHATCLSALRNALDKSAGPPDGVTATAAGAAEGHAGVGGGPGSEGVSASGTETWPVPGGMAGSHWGQRSLFESIMLPNCEGVVAHSLEPYMYGSTAGAMYGYGDASEFHDACSRFGSLASSLVSSVTQGGSNLIGYVAASGSAAVGGAMEWMGAAGGQPSQPGSPYPANGTGAFGGADGHGLAGPPTGVQTGGGLLGHAATAQGASGAALGGAVGPAAPQPYSGAGAVPTATAPAPRSSPPPVVRIHAHVSHSALVLCYAPAASTDAHSVGQHHQHRNAASHAASAARGTRIPQPSATSSSCSAASGGGGSLVVELHDVGCDVWLDAAHGNGIALQAGQVQVYEQLPAAEATRQGITAAEWSRVPEILPQAPYRFRPSQPSPTAAAGRGGAGADGGGVALGARGLASARPHGRNGQASGQQPGGGAAGGGGLEIWPILSCASTSSHGTAAAGPAAATGAAPGHPGSVGSGAHSVKAPGSKPGATAAAAAGVSGCLRLRASWSDGNAGADDYGRYGREGCTTSTPSYDISLELLPVTLWLSLPLVERVSAFVAPLTATETGGRLGRGVHSNGKMIPTASKPPSPLPRLSLAVMAPHVCVLMALLPASPLMDAGAAPRPPGSPVFLALDIVSPPHNGLDAHLAPPSPAPRLPHPSPYAAGHHHGYNQHGHHPYAPYTSTGYGGHAHELSSHANGHSHGAYGGGTGGGGWPNYGSAGHPHDHGGSSPALHTGYAGAYAPAAAWPAAGVHVPLVSVFQAPATDRLIPSQVTTVDVAAGVVELLLVRTGGCAGGSPTAAPQAVPARLHVHAPGVPRQEPWGAGGANGRDPSGASAAWTSKLLVSLTPLPALPPLPTHVGLSGWAAAPHGAPPIGPADVPPGCGLHLHLCSDPGVGSAPDVVLEAWEHATTHAQDRWGDPDGEGGAWEDRSSFRSVAFHERCRKSSATFVHLRAPKALVHLTRADMSDLVTLPAVMVSRPAPPATPSFDRAASSPAPAARGPASGSGFGANGSSTPGAAGPTRTWSAPAVPVPPPQTPAPQTCALLEVCLTIQLQDDPAPAGAPAAAAAASSGGSSVTGSAGGPGSGTAAAGVATPPHVPPHGGFGAGLGIGGSHVAMYELRLEELTVFRASGLGGPQAATAAAHGLWGPAGGLGGGGGICNVTSVHVHGVTLMGHLEVPPSDAHRDSGAHGRAHGQEPPGGPLRPQQQQPGGHGLQHRRPGTHPHATQGYVAPSLDPHQQRQHPGSAGPKGAATAAGGGGGGTQGRSICLVHCPRSAGAADKAPSYIEYVCFEGPQPSPSPAGADLDRGFGGKATDPWTAPTTHDSLPLAVSGRTLSSRSGEGKVEAAAAAKVPAPWVGCAAVHSVLLQGVTISTDHGFVSMDWAAQLGALLASAAPQPAVNAGASTADSSVSSGGGGGTGGRAYLSVNIVDLALRHEPMEYPELPATTETGAKAGLAGSAGAAGSGLSAGPAAAAAAAGPVRPVALALIVEAVHFGLPLGPTGHPQGSSPQGEQGQAAAAAGGPPAVHTVVLHSLTLHLASVDARGPGWDAGDPRALREPLLQASGYHRVLQETLIRVVAKQRRYPCRPRASSAPSAADLAAVAAAAAAAAASDPSQGRVGASEVEDGAAADRAAMGAGAGAGAAAQEEQFHTTMDVEITNQHLMGMLTVESATLLAHFAMQAGTLMTARQAAAVAAAAAAAGAPARRNTSCRPGSGPAGLSSDFYCDASSEAGSSALGAVTASSAVGAGGASDAGGDAAGSLLTALLLDEVEENAFRMVARPAALAAAAAAGGVGTSASPSLSASGVLQGHGAGWYTAHGAGDASGPDGSGTGAGCGPAGGLILIDDFFPVNHKGEYDEDLTLVECPAELKEGRPGGGWRLGASKAELEGTWYGPDEGPDERPSSRAASCRPGAAHGPNSTAPVPHLRSSGGSSATLACGGACGVPQDGPSDPHSSASGSMAASLRGCEAYLGGQGGTGAEGGYPDPGLGADSGCFLFDVPSGGAVRMGPGGQEAQQAQPPDIDDLLAGMFPVGVEPGHRGALATAAAGAGAEAAGGGEGGIGGARGRGGGGMGSLTAAPSVVSVGSSSATGFSTAPTWRLQEDYVRVPRKSDEDGSGPVSAGVGVVGGSGVAGAAGHGPGGSEHTVAANPWVNSSGVPAGGDGVEQPPPLIRIAFKDLSGIWVMHTTRSSSSASPASAASTSASGQQEGRVELVVEGLGLLMESYGPGGHLARHIKLTIHDLEIRDCALEARQQQQQHAAAAASAATAPLAAVGSGLASLASVGAAAAAAAGSGARARAAAAAVGGGASGWVRVLGYRAVRGRPRDSRAPLVAVALTAVRPNPAACDPRDEEFRLGVALLPLRLKLNQDIMSYLTWYGTSVSTALKPAAAVLNAMQTALSELGGCEPLPPPYFQRAQIRGFTIMLDYRPRRVDIGALAEGRLTELLNLVPLGGVDLACKPLRLAGVQGWDGLGAVVLREWLNDIARTQAHKFITGLAPVNAVVKVGSAVATLLAAPARHLARREAAAGRHLAAQLRRTSATFATKLVLEAMAAGRKAASGAGKALVRVGSSALGTYGAAGGCGYEDGPAEEYGRGQGDEEEEEGAYGSGDDDEVDGYERNGRRGAEDECEEGDEDDVRGTHTVGSYHGGTVSAASANGSSGKMRRSRSASAVVKKGLFRAALSLGSASQQVAAAAAAGLQGGGAVGLQRGVSSVARALTAAAATSVSAAAPLQGQIKGTLRSVRKALGAQLVPQGPAGGRQGQGQAPVQGPVAAAAGGYPAYPRPKED